MNNEDDGDDKNDLVMAIHEIFEQDRIDQRKEKLRKDVLNKNLKKQRMKRSTTSESIIIEPRMGRPVGSPNRRKMIIDILIDLHGHDVAEKLVKRATEFAFGVEDGMPKVKGDPDMVKFLIDKVYSRPTPKSYVTYDLEGLTNINEIQMAMTYILRLVSHGQLAIEDSSKIINDLAALKDFILGTKLEDQYHLILQKLEEKGMQ